MTSATLEPRPPRSPLALVRRRFDDIDRASWDRLLAATPHATPFSRWTFHRAWWDAFRDTADDHYLVLEASTGAPAPSADELGAEPAGDVASEQLPPIVPLRAIIPLMVRDASDEGRVLFMGASYHADYAAILAALEDLPDTVTALAATLAPERNRSIRSGLDALDLRRLRQADPTPGLLTSALRSLTDDATWHIERMREDVCPVLALSSDWDEQVSLMSRVARHELRRKLRRVDRAGAVQLRHLPLEPATVERFIALHQARWGESGLFGASDDGERSRTFFHRLAELEAAEGPSSQLLFVALSVDDRIVSSSVVFDDGTTCFYYNAGMDPAARDLSPGVIGTAMLIRDRIEAGTRRFDFLRGDEAYKYEWGAVDEPIERVLMRRAG